MKSPGTIGIIAALAAEARTLGAMRRRSDGLRSLPDGTLLAVSGMGYEAAARSARRLAEAGCGALASWGLAGGLDPALAPGMIVVPERLICEGARTLGAAAEWRGRVLASLDSRRVAGGGLLTTPRALVSAAEKRAAFERTGAVAVDMESHAIAQVAAERGLPFLAVRVIVDAAGDEVPQVLADAADATGRVAVARLVLRVLAAPATVVPLLRLASRYRAARNALCSAARAGPPDKGGA